MLRTLLTLKERLFSCAAKSTDNSINEKCRIEKEGCHSFDELDKYGTNLLPNCATKTGDENAICILKKYSERLPLL